MRARVAYISSLGTTAILVAAALLMLAVVGAIVAFRGWPGSANDSGVQSVPLAPHSTPARTALVRGPNPVRAVTRSASVRATVRRVSTAGLVKQPTVGPSVVPGVVLVPVDSAPANPPASHPDGPGDAPQGEPGRPGPSAPGDSGDGGALPGTGGPLPVSPPSAGGLPSDTGALDALVAELLGSAPPPPALTGVDTNLARARVLPAR